MSNNIIDKIQLSGITYDIGGQGGSGVSVVEVTQAEYDVLPSSAKTDTSKMYVITDAEAGDLTNYYTKSETNTLLGDKADTATTYTKTEVDNAITAATSTKQDTLVSGTNIKTINNTSILGSGNIDIQGGGGGGKAVSAGTNISITTGETADTINCTLPISADTSHSMGVKANYSENTAGHMSFAGGYVTKAKMDYSFAFGMGAETDYFYSTAIGQYTKTTCWGETAFGCYNKSAKVSANFDGNSGNTLFSVGNGTSSARHNAFEIRQNGDIYITSGNTDIKLQDHLGGGGGGGSSYTAGDGIDITNNVISVTGKVDTTTYSAYTANTTAALFGLNNKMNDIEPKVNSAWTKGVRDLLWYPTSSGLTLEYNIMSGGTYQFAVQPMDESLRYGENASGVNKYLGVYASGNTYSLLVNKYNNTVGGYRITFPMAYKASKVTLQLNSAYTGQTPTTNAIQAYYYDNNGVNYNPKWDYNSGTDSFTNSTEYTGITFAYDQITKIITLTLDSSYNYIRGVRTAKNFADENDLTNPSYYIGAVTIETNSYKLQEVLDSKQDTLIAGENITISGNVISATGGGGGGMTEDDELLLSTALTDLNDRKIDASEVKSNYQKKGDYVTTSTLNTRLAEYETALDEQNVEEVTAYALNDLNERFGGLKITKITESEYEALTTKDENTLYVVVADPS